MMARRTVPSNATLSHADLRREAGEWRYDFVFTVPGQRPPRTVRVNAANAAIIRP
jgi:hypothetical protein